MSDILEEITRDIKEERSQQIFIKALPVIIAVTLIFVTMVGIKNWLNTRNQEHNQKMGDIYQKALVELVHENQILANESLEHLIAHADNGVAELANLTKINILLEKNDKAVEQTLADIITNKKYHTITQSYAKLLYVVKALDQDPQAINQETIDSYSKDLADSSSPFYGIGSVIRGVWLTRQNKIDEARQVLQLVIANQDVPQGVKQIGGAVLSNISQQN